MFGNDDFVYNFCLFWCCLSVGEFSARADGRLVAGIVSPTRYDPILEGARAHAKSSRNNT